MLQLVNITSSIEGRYIMKANPKELQEIYNLVCKTQWDLGRDESVKDRAKKIIEFCTPRDHQTNKMKKNKSIVHLQMGFYSI